MLENNPLVAFNIVDVNIPLITVYKTNTKANAAGRQTSNSHGQQHPVVDSLNYEGYTVDLKLGLFSLLDNLTLGPTDLLSFRSRVC